MPCEICLACTELWREKPEGSSGTSEPEDLADAAEDSLGRLTSGSDASVAVDALLDAIDVSL